MSNLLDELMGKDKPKKKEKLLSKEDLDAAVKEFSKNPSAEAFQDLLRISKSVED